MSCERKKTCGIFVNKRYVQNFLLFINETHSVITFQFSEIKSYTTDSNGFVHFQSTNIEYIYTET